MWLYLIELTGLDQGGKDGPILSPSIMPGEEGVFAIQGDGTDGAFDRIIIELDAAIAQEQA